MNAENVLVPSVINYLTLYVKTGKKKLIHSMHKSPEETFLGYYISEK